jgi:hypothetical protein
VTVKSPSCTRLAAALLVSLTLLLSPSVSAASPDTLQRAFGDMIQGPIDVLLSPIVAGKNLVHNMRDIDDPIPVRLVFAGPGYIWLTGIQLGAGLIRGISGAFELLPGIALFALDADLDPLMAPVDRSSGLVEVENSLQYSENPFIRYNPLLTPVSFHIKFGINYTSSD